MSSTARRSTPRESINLRIRPELCSLIDRAAEARGTNRANFILDASRRAAEETLLDRALLPVSDLAYAEFLARLDAPAAPNERLRRTLAAPVPWKTR